MISSSRRSVTVKRGLARAMTSVPGQCGCGWLCLLLVLGSPAAWANPLAPVVKAGQVTFTHNGSTFTVDQATHHAIVNWGGFGNNAGETIRFNQPTSTAAILNRVTGGDPTKILGDLSANGRVFVLNPNGVLVGAGARIDTHGFYASTREVSDDAFLAGGDLAFSGDANASVVNLGTITAHDGDIVLIARTVENHGTLNAPRGTAALAAGTEVLLKARGADRIYILSGPAGETAAKGIDNTGVVNAAQAELKAAGGNAYALAVNSGGSITATGIATIDGRVVLTADAGAIAVSGNLTARNADGSGGEILVGGDYQGGNAANVARAATTTITTAAHLDASASASHESPRDGGKIVVWSDGTTRFDGRISATGAQGGDAEVSGKTLALTGHADLRSTAGGRAGTLLLDPTDLTIDNSATAYDAGAPAASSVGNAWIGTQLAAANVALQATDTITGNTDAPVSWSTANVLTLRAGTSIVLNGDITGSHAGSELAFENAAIVNAPAVITVGTVRYGGTGPKQTFHLANAANAFATLIVNDGEGSGYTQFGGSFNAVSNRSLTLGRATSNFRDAFHLQSAGAPVTIRANGDLTLAHDYTQFSGDFIYGSGDITLRAVGGQFVNHSGLQDLSLNNPAARVLIYSTSPLTFNGTVFDDGGLTGFTSQRGIASTSALTPGTGHYFYFQNHLLTLTPLDASRTYGQANPTFAYNITGNTGPSTPALTGLTLATTATDASNAGTYAITASGATATDYDIAYQPGTLTVDRAALTVSAAAPDRAYGAANGPFTATYFGLANGDTGASVVTPAMTSTATAATDVGSATIAVSGPATTANYNVTYVDGTFAITPANLTVTARDATRDYGDADPVFTAFGTGYVQGEGDALLTGVTFNTAATITSNVGTYTIMPVGGSAPNYAITQYLPGTLTITPADLMLQITGGTRVYGATNPVFTGTVLNGLRNGDTFDFTTLSLSTDATAASGVGSYAITGVAGPVGNYQPVLIGNAVLTITPALLTLSANDATRVWGDDNPAFGYTLTGMVNGDAAPTVLGVSFTTTALRSSDAGVYGITPAAGVLTSNANYQIGAFASGTLTIDPLEVAITADAFRRAYGEFNPLGFTGTYTSNSVSNPAGTFGAGGAGFAGGTAQVRLATAATTATGVGDYDFATVINGTAAGNIRATLTPGSGRFTITPALLTVTPYLTLTRSTSPPPDPTDSPLAEPITQVTADYKATGTEYAVTTYKQESADTSGGVTFVKVVSTPLGANAITGTNADGTVRMQVLNARYTSADGVTYARDPAPHVDNSEGTITFNPNSARAITIADPLPGLGLVTSGLKNNDTLSFTYTKPAMPSANATYALSDLTINAGPNYTVNLVAADLSYRLDPLRLRLVLPDLSIPANFFLPDDADASFNIADDLTLEDLTQIYLSQIQLLNAPTSDQLFQAANSTRVTRALGGGTSGTAAPVLSAVPGEGTVIAVGSNVTITTPGSTPTRPAVPAVGTTAIERIPGFRLGNRNFIAGEVARIASLIKRGAAEQTGNSPAELRNFYPVTPSISFNHPYLTGGVEYPLAYKAILPTGALIKTPKTWSNLIVGPQLPPPLPPDSQNTAAGIAAAEAALDQIRADTFGNIGERLAGINVGAIDQLDYALWREFPDLFIQIPARDTNAFGLTSASDEFLGKALWLWAVSRDLPVTRGAAAPGDVATWYMLAATDEHYKAEVAGFLAMLMSDVLVRQTAAARDPVHNPALSPGDAAFLADFDAYISERQAIAFNQAAAAQESWINERFAVSLSNVEGTRSSLLALTNTGHIGEKRPPPPEEFRKAAANWTPEVTPNDPAFQTVLRTLGYAADEPATSPAGNAAGAMTARSAVVPETTVGAFSQTGRQFVDNGVMEAIFAGLPKPAAVPKTSIATQILDAVFPHTRSATLGTLATGVLMGASFVVEGLLGVLEADIEAARFTKKMNDLRDKVSTDPKTSLDILQTNPLIGRATTPGDTSARLAQNQLEARGYSDAGMVTLMALFTTMVVGDPNQQVSNVGQYNQPTVGSRFNPQL